MSFAACFPRRSLSASDDDSNFSEVIPRGYKLVWCFRSHNGDLFPEHCISVYLPRSRPPHQQERPTVELKAPSEQESAKSAFNCQVAQTAAPPTPAQALPAKDTTISQLHDCRAHTPAPCLVFVACGDSSDDDSLASPTSAACFTPTPAATPAPALPAPVVWSDNPSDDESLPSPTKDSPTPPKHAPALPAPVDETQRLADMPSPTPAKNQRKRAWRRKAMWCAGAAAAAVAVAAGAALFCGRSKPLGIKSLFGRC